MKQLFLKSRGPPAKSENAGVGWGGGNRVPSKGHFFSYDHISIIVCPWRPEYLFCGDPTQVSPIFYC